MSDLGPRFVERSRWTTDMRSVSDIVDLMLACNSCGMRRPVLRSVFSDMTRGEQDLAKIEPRLRCT